MRKLNTRDTFESPHSIELVREQVNETYDMVVLYADPLFVVNSKGEIDQRLNCFEHQEEYKILTNAIK